MTILRFDVTDAVMRRLKQDPYGAEKRRFAHATRQWRLSLRRKHKAALLQQALARYKLTGPTCRRYREAGSAGRRRLRRVLFERWDETVHEGSGRAIRAAILRLVNVCGMDYPPAELRALNGRRRSAARFTP